MDECIVAWRMCDTVAGLAVAVVDLTVDNF